MAATTDEEMDSLLSTADEIYQGLKNGVAEIQTVKSACIAEAKKREALEFTCTSLKQENERLARLYTESLNDVADQLERRSACRGLKDELNRLRDECFCKEEEHKKALELVKHEYTARVDELEAHIRGLLLEKAKNEATIDHLRQDLAAHKSHMHVMQSRLDRVQSDVETKYMFEIQDLRDCMAIEQEEKTELNRKLQDLDKEMLVSRSKLVQQQGVLNSNGQVETLKSKLMKLRKENEILKRKLHSADG